MLGFLGCQTGRFDNLVSFLFFFLLVASCFLRSRWRRENIMSILGHSFLGSWWRREHIRASLGPETLGTNLETLLAQRARFLNKRMNIRRRKLT
ncbi:hypothetical protein HanPI659440_Chr14g0541791 [Helianthus annuus]|nr:hypothetical protein HanPI659440_Chr14g0541791 [Helianthus annuus]